MKRAIKYSINDADADSLIQEAKEEYEKKIAEYSVTLNRLRNEMSDLSGAKSYDFSPHLALKSAFLDGDTLGQRLLSVIHMNG